MTRLLRTHMFAWWDLYDPALAQHLATANVGSTVDYLGGDLSDVCRCADSAQCTIDH